MRLFRQRFRTFRASEGPVLVTCPGIDWGADMQLFYEAEGFQVWYLPSADIWTGIGTSQFRPVRYLLFEVSKVDDLNAPLAPAAEEGRATELMEVEPMAHWRAARELLVVLCGHLAAGDLLPQQFGDVDYAALPRFARFLSSDDVKLLRERIHKALPDSATAWEPDDSPATANRREKIKNWIWQEKRGQRVLTANLYMEILRWGPKMHASRGTINKALRELRQEGRATMHLGGRNTYWRIADVD